jgi:DNA-binding CsgD family transcriptional regulator
MRLAQGQSEAAVSGVRRALAETKDPLPRARLLPSAVHIFLRADELEDARAACAELEDIAARYQTEVLGALAAHARGVVHLHEGDAQAALGPLRRTFWVWQKIGAPYETARVRVDLAAACAALGDLEGAKLALDAARAAFAELGAAPDLTALDAPEEEHAASGSHGLTQRELQVLRLVASGKTNKAIAKELCLSEKTIDRHVSNIFSKVNVASRAAATAFAYEHHLI